MSETLRTLVEKWRERAELLASDYDSSYTEVEACAAELEAAITPPVGTCETCRYQVKQDRMCQILLFAAGVEVRRMEYSGHAIERPGDPRFSCSAYSPLPPAAPGGEG